MGGGAGGGGGSGDGSGDGDGNGPADGDGSGDGANGDGSNADSCGNGSNAGDCTNCGDNVQRGDPVDVVTGRVFTTSLTDVFLPGILALELSHSYSSASAKHDVGLGYGWRHSFSWEINIRRDRLELWTAEGTRFEFMGTEWPVGTEIVGRFGWLLRREATGFVLMDRMNLRRRVFRTEKSPGRFALDAVEDRNGNRIELHYRDGHLVRIVDAVGRPVQLELDSDHHVARIRVPNSQHQAQWVDFARFEYDENGNLLTHIDADGVETRYSYDDRHLLTLIREPGGLHAHFVYDTSARCIETWCDNPNGDDSVDSSVSTTLYDNQTIAKGVLHCVFHYEPHYTEVVDSVKVQRFFGNRFGRIEKGITSSLVTTRKYDDHGHVVAMTDPLGSTTTYTRDERGRLLSKTDALGRTWRFKRDPSGLVVHITDPEGGISLFDYDSQGNLVRVVEPGGAVSARKYDQRGALIEMWERNGARTAYQYDAHGNRVAVQMPNGGVWRSTYDYFGQRVSATDALGGTTHFTYSQRGDLLSVRDAEGAVRRHTWDGRGNMLAVSDKRNATTRCRYGGYDKLVEVQKPDGEKLTLRYNREGWLLRLVNERGESHLYEYDTLGRPVRTISFDGSIRKYRYDAAGRLSKFTNGSGEVTEYEYNAVNELTRRGLANGDEELFHYDQRGLLASAKNGATSVQLTRDLNGNIVREVQEAFDETFEVKCSFGPLGVREELVTSRGHQQSYARDSMGWRSALQMDGARVDLERDFTGQLRTRRMNGGGVIESEFDVVGRLTRRSAFGVATRPTDPKAPSWLGTRPPNLSSEMAFRYELGGELLEEWNDTQGSRGFEYDVLRQVLSVTHSSGPREVYRYDSTCNMHDVTEGAAPRVYGAGNRLMSVGGMSYEWDKEGRLAKKWRHDERGAKVVWRYNWNARGLLGSVERPDGSVVSFDYDALSRRVRKRAAIRGADGALHTAETTRYLWDGENVLQDIRRTAAKSGDPIVEERTFVFEEDGFTPFAQRSSVKRRDDELVEGPWLYFMNDGAGAPEKLVNSRGELVSDSGRDLWGKSFADATPIRFMGQWSDDETGLHYCRYRYYDPEIGRFISYDPMGPDAGPNSFIYAPNTLSYVDPFGLIHFASAALFNSEEDFRNEEEPIATTRQVDSRMTRSQRERIEAAGPAGSDERNSEIARQRSRCHTERKICDPPAGLARRGDASLQEGQCLVIDAESVDGSRRRPPCSGCQGAMIRLSRDRNATVIYRPGASGRMDRPFIVRNGVVEARG